MRARDFLNTFFARPAQWALSLVSRISENILALRIRGARARGYVPTVLPYTSYGSTEQVRVLGRVLLINPRPTVFKRTTSIRGWRSFTSLPIGNAEVTVGFGDQEFEVQSDAGGVVDTDVPFSMTPGWHHFTMTTRAYGVDSTPSRAQVKIVDPSKHIGVVCDIDDTVMVTTLPRPLLAAWNTFVLDEHARTPTPGMAVFLERLTTINRDAPVIYLSTGAWNVAPTLRRFLSRNLYPAGPLLLTDWGPTRERWFRSGLAHKQDNLRRLAADFPGLKWVLIGDDGQHDESIYAEFAREHPENVAAICIRELSASEAVLAGGRSEHAMAQGATDVPWVYAPDGAAMAAKLEELELLPHKA